MITYEEAAAVHNEEQAREDAIDGLEDFSETSDEARERNRYVPMIKKGRNSISSMSAKIIARLPSIRIKREAVAPRSPSFFRGPSFLHGPSFFRKVFSTRKLNRVVVKDGDNFSDASGSDLNENPNGFAKRTVRRRKGDDEYSNSDWDDDEVLEEEKADEPLPPMPKLGAPVRMDLMVNRHTSAYKSMDMLMQMVQEDVQSTLQVVHRIPVGHEYDRVTVTPEISRHIALVRSSQGIQERLAKNAFSVQKALSYRHSSLIIMNSNYMNKQVRKLEPTYGDEVRTIVIHKS
jgi:hypothetical protein